LNDRRPSRFELGVAQRSYEVAGTVEFAVAGPAVGFELPPEQLLDVKV
jgi:hypothetical protein